MRDFNGPDIFGEAENSSDDRFVVPFKPRPQKRVGRQNSLCSMSLGGGFPVTAGINLHLIASSRGCSNILISGVVRRIYAQLFVNPLVKEA